MLFEDNVNKCIDISYSLKRITTTYEYVNI